MLKIKPFKGYIYNINEVKDLGLVTAPPYDVISKEEQDNLYKKNPYNIVRLILNKDESDDDNLSKYKRAGELFKKWQKENVLIQDKEESIYIYEQEFILRGAAMKRKGFIALAKLEDFSSGTIKPHEKTLSAPKEDRLNLMKHCGANFSSVFGLYEDPTKEVEKIIQRVTSQKPLFEFLSNSIKERFWRLSDTEDLQQMCCLMGSKAIFIADGHHRYETALNYRNEMRKKLGNDNNEHPFDYVMMTFIAMEDEGLVILPTHRLVFDVNISKDTLLTKLDENFVVEAIKINSKEDNIKLINSMVEKSLNNHTIGMVLKDDENAYLLTLKKDPKNIIKENKSDSLKSLDVTILHSLILENVFGLTEESISKQINLKYEKNENNVFELIKSGKYQAAFLLNPTKIEELKAVAKEGERMPQKSTFFYPKLTTGLVINKIIN